MDKTDLSLLLSGLGLAVALGLIAAFAAGLPDRPQDTRPLSHAVESIIEPSRTPRGALRQSASRVGRLDPSLEVQQLPSLHGEVDRMADE
jgi:hypothetical protein